jgi:hypothetical protein
VTNQGVRGVVVAPVQHQISIKVLLQISIKVLLPFKTFKHVCVKEARDSFEPFATHGIRY